ncbi:MAG: hypothetical protein Q9214_002241 [Letrouitia sp. 1 TL-2023]
MPTPAVPSSWSQGEFESSQSKQRPIPLDEQTKVFSWENVRDIVETNRLDVIRRKPSERIVYKAWCKNIIATYGSITKYMCVERLRWGPLPESSAESGPAFDYQSPTPFADTRDFNILRNDWPYGSFAPDITHLIVWSKPRIEIDPQNGLVTPESRQLVDAFVERTFVKRLEQDDPLAGKRVLWFKNWGALQSVRGLEHIHVLVKDAPGSIVEEWTGEKEVE